jgi:hypothetical protein
MTSFGRFSPARVPAGLAILAFTAALFLPQVCAEAGSVFGSKASSARMQALGTTFRWIIPDQLTDISINPARAWDAGSLTINYGIRHSSSYALPFPVTMSNQEPDFFYIDPPRTNEVRLYGASEWGWKWAMEAEWRLFHEDGCNQLGIDPFDRSSSGDVRLELRENCDIDDDNFLRFDIASARKISDRAVLGLRAGMTYQYENSQIRDRYVYDYYEYDSGIGGYIPDYGRSQDRVRNSATKHFTGYIETGLAWEESGELVLRGGYSQGTYNVDNYDLRIDTGYDYYTGEMNDYDYYIDEPREDREGDSWLLSAAVKKRYQGGLVIIASGQYERGSFESEWGRSYSQYSWGTYSYLQIEDRYGIIGEGTRSRSQAGFKLGKTYSLERRLDLTPGANIYYWREKFEEEGQAYISSQTDATGEVLFLSTDFPVAFDKTVSSTVLVLPVAIEFRAASFFSVYSGFGLTFRWTRESQKSTLLLSQSGIADPSLPEEIEVDGNTFVSDYTASLGFSLRYRDKLFFDMYTYRDIVPEYIDYYYYTFDLRYVF